MVRIGIVGAGSIVRARHLPNLRELDGVEVVAVANRRADSARAVAEEYRIGRVEQHWQDVVTSPDVEAVLIGTPPSMHEEVTLAAIGAGKHVFCQARMALDLQAARRMLQADARTSLTTMLCPAPHYMQVMEHVRDLLRSGQPVGEVRHVVINHASGMFADPEKPLHWRQRRDISGINVLDIGIVVETLHQWVGTAAEVCASTSTWVEQRPADGDGRTRVEAPDAVNVIGTLRDGGTLTALFSGAVRGAEPSITIHGTAGTLVCRPFSATIEVGTDDGGTRAYEVPEAERGSWTVEADFLRAIRAGEKGVPSFTDGAKYTAFTQAVLEASRSERRTRVPSTDG